MRITNIKSTDGHQQPDCRAENQSESDYVLQTPYQFTIEIDNTDVVFEVPERFETDLNSVPPMFRWFVERDGVQRPAGLVHDYIARSDFLIRSIKGRYYKLDRKINDQLYEDILDIVGIKSYQRRAMYLAVRGYSIFRNLFKI